MDDEIRDNISYDYMLCDDDELFGLIRRIGSRTSRLYEDGFELLCS